MANFGVTEQPAGVVLDLTTPRLSRELAELEERLHVLRGLLDALGRLPEVNQTIQFASDRSAALAALQHEPFGYSHRQAQAIIDMPMSWQSFDEADRLRQERDRLVARQASLRERVSEVLALHWFG
jgi:DNA gyrase/topoisomerase IV subunit A